MAHGWEQWTERQQRYVAPNRAVDEAYCILNEAGHPASFSAGRISQQSGSQYEKLVTSVVKGFSRKLRAVRSQTQEEGEALKDLRNRVADFLRDRVSDNAGQRVTARGVGEEEADIDVVFHGSFEALLSQLNLVTEAKVIATCEDVTCVLVEACSDSRLVAMKLLQIEIQCRIVARQGFLVRDDPRGLEAQALLPRSTGYAIVFNRAALQINIQSVLDTLGLTYVQELQQQGKLHIAFLQADRALPAALEIASEARAEAREARAKVDRLEKDLAGIRRVNLRVTYALLWFLPWHVILRGFAGTTSAPSTVWVRELDSKESAACESKCQQPTKPLSGPTLSLTWGTESARCWE